MRDKIKAFIASHPYISTSVAAVVGYYGGPKGLEVLQKAAALFGLI